MSSKYFAFFWGNMIRAAKLKSKLVLTTLLPSTGYTVLRQQDQKLA
jgi:hypothetical protein